ncbi:hypothetical protein SY27_13645 [Flavobacterium sp. 316]|uniref:hypothetical protein n=1 Tax=Flavobacterium sp. 316 TaxID=1603293 RepID=UPI0005DC087E|nr:hypothetical protein [Flavobacterium sp. 316]KIX20187.1 hypothetical protein SY27_13645 [Flavobacterium sp. 316]
MKTKFILLFILGICLQSIGQEKAKAKDLSRLTIGIGIGGNHLFKSVYDYSLTTDSNYNLKITELNKNSIVVSPVLAFRLGKVKMSDVETKAKFFNDTENKDENLPLGDYRRFSILLSTDLVNIQSDKVSYNKRIDGGIGVGYSFSPNLMIGVFYEIKSYRQLREYVVEQYENQAIPNGNEFFNALDETNNNLFYNKQIEGLSIKLIFNFNTL